MSGIQIEMSSKLRPCYVQVRLSKIEKALFHCWSPNGTHLTEGTVGIVELEDGCVIEAKPVSIKFIDNIFQDYCWDEKGDL